MAISSDSPETIYQLARHNIEDNLNLQVILFFCLWKDQNF